MQEKTYINGLFIKKKTFQNGGEVINISINVNKFVEELMSHENEKGYCNIVFNNRKEADKNGNNMYAILDTFKPKETDKKSDDLPF